MKERRGVLALINWYLPGFKAGGPVKTLHNLVEAIGDEYEFKIVTSDRDLGDKWPYVGVVAGAWNSRDGVNVLYVCPGIRGVLQIYRVLSTGDFDGLYLNSFFSLKFALFPLLVGKWVKSRILVCPKGQFSKGALAIGALKKSLYVRLFKAFGLQNGIVWQASTDYEKEDIIRAIGPDTQIVVAEDISSREFATELSLKADDALRVVFVSRISPKKNLDGALKMLRQVRVPITFDIYGPIEDRPYWKRCELLIGELPDNVVVEYKGVLEAQEVISVLSHYDLFFFPTLGENFGHVIAESLCAGLPVLVSDRTPWRNLERQGIGWDIPLVNVEEFVEIIHRAFKMNDDEYRLYRENILGWAVRRFEDPAAVESNRKALELAFY